MEYVHHYASPLGRITAAGTENALTGLWFDGQKYFGSTLSEGCAKDCPQKDLSVFKQTDLWLDIYFCGKIPDFTPPLLLTGTPFRKAVWNILLEIPYGKTATYGEIAAELAKQRDVPKMSAQAVGNAVGHNPVSLIVPCHRVVGADGSLTGYAGGTAKKAWLLNLEKAEILSKNKTASM